MYAYYLVILGKCFVTEIVVVFINHFESNPFEISKLTIQREREDEESLMHPDIDTMGYKLTKRG